MNVINYESLIMSKQIGSWFFKPRETVEYFKVEQHIW